MKYIDKNDVEINKLFNWGDVLEIKNTKGELLLKVYMRVIGDAELNRARVFSLRKSAEMRKKLQESDSDERLAFIPEIDVVGKETIIEAMLLAKVRDITSKATRELDIKMPKEPGADATLEEQEKFQAEVDAWPDALEKTINKAITKEMEKERKRYQSLPDNQLNKEYERLSIERLCETEMYTIFQDMCVFFSCYKDENYKHKLFNSFDEFLSLPSIIKERLLDFYNTLTIDLENLKKLPEVTPL